MKLGIITSGGCHDVCMKIKLPLSKVEPILHEHGLHPGDEILAWENDGFVIDGHEETRGTYVRLSASYTREAAFAKFLTEAAIAEDNYDG